MALKHSPFSLTKRYKFKKIFILIQEAREEHTTSEIKIYDGLNISMAKGKKIILWLFNNVF
jgi:hypothetical protein